MLKKILFITLLVLSSSIFAGSEYDRDITVLDQSRNEKVKKVFKEMMASYEDGDIKAFFSFVSEDRFEQDYMTFYEAIDQDLRTYDILSIESWVNKTTADGVKRYLYVRWDKRYQSIDSNTEINQRGYSRFLFDEVNGKYKLIQLAGNNFWGTSLPEWREEVPQIAGQETEGLPDLTVTVLSCVSGTVTFTLNNIGIESTKSGRIEYDLNSGVYDFDIGAGESSQSISEGSVNCFGSGTIKVDPNNLIEESDETNNEAIIGSGAVT